MILSTGEMCLLPGVWSRGVAGPGGVSGPGECLLPGEGGVPGGDPPRDGYSCGRYASYWNAFLFSQFSDINE